MKKLIMTAAVVACAGIVSAQVYSANIVGYAKETVSASSFKIVANQFHLGDEAGVTIGEAFGNQLPSGSELYVYDGTYTVYSYFGTWFDPDFGSADGVVIPRGASLWVKENGGSSVDFLFSGEVPTAAVSTNVLATGFNMVANPYPVAMTLSDLSGIAVSGDEVYVYDGTYTVYSFFGSWFDPDFGGADSVSIPVGAGFWYKNNSGSAINWVVNKPY